MGLDTVELTMEIEDEFNIFIPDSNAAEMVTVGDTYNFILQQKDRPVVPAETCLTHTVFLRIRRGLMKVFQIPRRNVRPDCRLDALIPARVRRRRWDEFAQFLLLPLPSLRRPAWLLGSGLIALVLPCGYLAVWLGPMAPLPTVEIISIVVLTFFVIFIPATDRLRCVLPASCTTVGRLARHVVKEHPRLISAPASIGTPAEVWEKLRALIVRQLGVRPEEVTPQARWHKDFGV